MLPPARPARRRFQPASLLAVPAAVGVVLVSQLLDGGSARALLQPTAALIVIGGTLAATLISYAPGAVLDAGTRAALDSVLAWTAKQKGAEWILG